MKYVLMDLDGTITNPKLGITKSVQYALKAKNIEVEDLDSLCKFIGPPLVDSFMQFYGFTEQEAEESVDKYREYYTDKGIFENEVYPGMEDLLDNLKQAGKVVIVATSKPEAFARQILEHFLIDGYFDDICGATMDRSRTTKEEVIRYALLKNGITDLPSTVMVGDRKFDIEGAKTVGISSMGVLFGFGSREELEKAGCDRIAETVEEILDIVISFAK